MSLSSGQILAHYEILAPLGSGAMAEVYRAQDTRLKRQVALKVLPEEFAKDQERLLRFEREAKALAALNHPNVAQIFGFERQGDTLFLVLELVPGQTLEERIAQGRLTPDETAELGWQIAAGLEAAHEAGVVHRDLKPANIRITPDGKAKVLDFGLAKPVGPRAGSESGSASDSVLRTEQGRLIGTPTYMAPEQARGRPIDRRVDVWAFGCVLFECLSGARPFAGQDLSDVLVAVLERPPDWRQLPTTTSEVLRSLIARCLVKDPLLRLRDIGEARIALASSPPTAAPSRGLGTSRTAVISGLAAAAAVGGLAGWMLVPRPPPQPSPASRAAEPFLLHRLSEMVGVEEMPAISPSGKQVAFVARWNGHRQVFVRLRTGGSPTPVTNFAADHSFPRWVDDSTLIYRRSDFEGGPGMLYESLIPSASHPEPLVEVESETDVDPVGRRWLATFRRDREGPLLALVDRQGKEPDRVYRLDEGSYDTPRWSPDGRHVAFEAWSHGLRSDIRVLDTETDESRTLVTSTRTCGLAWLPDGSGLVYASSKGSSLPYPPVFRLRTVRLDGSEDAALAYGDAGYASFERPDVSAAGKLVACRVDLKSDVCRYPVAHSALENTAKEEWITRQTGLVQVPSVSHDGDAVVYLSDSGGHANLWVQRRGESQPRQITKEADPDVAVAIAVWSPKEDRIVYVRTLLDEEPELHLVNSDGTGTPQLLLSGGVGPVWSPSGEWIHYTRVEGVLRSSYRVSVKTGENELVREDAVGLHLSEDGRTAYFQESALVPGRLWRASPPDSPTPQRLGPDLSARIPMLPHQFVLSPDGAWLAGPLKDGPTTNLFKLSTSDGQLVQITDFGDRIVRIGRQISWSPDGEFLYAAVMDLDSDIVLLEGTLR